MTLRKSFSSELGAFQKILHFLQYFELFPFLSILHILFFRANEVFAPGLAVLSRSLKNFCHLYRFLWDKGFILMVFTQILS